MEKIIKNEDILKTMMHRYRILSAHLTSALAMIPFKSCIDSDSDGDEIDSAYNLPLKFCSDYNHAFLSWNRGFPLEHLSIMLGLRSTCSAARHYRKEMAGTAYFSDSKMVYFDNELVNM
ncbi:uncharacterized protein N7479_000098 [Penicillium vulpinum]|uniref:uncharacterized protein n=1 Tax=Penicillium vulpinum TaxID=29845 RepID=UPI0025493523|nr:uncharacterized protein N7479_000098 [Penicillium vulpinum]KAJ5970180.1 hypothetical protein N7479_000098 [Penicillium vulpinum]